MTATSQVALDESDAASKLRGTSRASARLVIRRTAGKAARNTEPFVNKYCGQGLLLRQALQKGKPLMSIRLIDIMTDDALGRLQGRNDDMGVPSAEMIKRAVARGDMDAIPGIVAEAAAMGTGR